MERPILPPAIDGTQQRLDAVLDVLHANHDELQALRQQLEPKPAPQPADDPDALVPLREGPGPAASPAPRVPRTPRAPRKRGSKS